MTVINMGSGAAVYASGTANPTSTYIDKNNPANATGIINQFKAYFGGATTGAKMGIFRESPAGTYTCVAAQALSPDPVGGSVETWAISNLPVQAGDFVACYIGTGQLRRETPASGPGYVLCNAVDKCNVDDVSTDAETAPRHIALEALGTDEVALGLMAVRPLGF